MGRTVTRADLVDAVFRKVGLSRTETAELMEAVFDEISNALVRGEDVKLSGFAVFRVRAKNERPGRNPRTGEGQRISARNVASFKASNLTKARIQRQLASSKTKMKVKADRVTSRCESEH